MLSRCENSFSAAKFSEFRARKLVYKFLHINNLGYLRYKLGGFLEISPPFCLSFSYLWSSNKRMIMMMMTMMMSQLGNRSSKDLFVTSSSDIPLAMGK